MVDKPATRPVSPLLYTSLALLFALLWASAFMGVKVGLRNSPPLFLMGFRFLVAGSVLLVYARLRGSLLPDSWRGWARLGALGLLNQAAYLGLSAIAMRHLSGGMAAVLASTNPLMLALLAPALLGERMSLRRVAGLGLAFLSVVWIMYARASATDAPGSMLLILLANALMVAGTILFKRWAPAHNLVVINGVQLFTASFVLLIPSLLFESVSAVRWNMEFLGAVGFLAFGVSCGAMLIWFFLLRTGEAARASAFLFLNPVMGLFLGRLLLGEPLHPLDFVGGIGVALGIYLVQTQSSSVTRPASPSTLMR